VAQLYLDALADACPAPLVREGFLPALDLRAGRTQYVAAPSALKPFDVLAAGHAAIHHPDPLGQTETGLHRPHDLFHGGDVHSVAVEDLVAERDPLPGDHQSDADLLAVGPVVPAVAALRLRVPCGQALEVGTGDVVEQKVVLQSKELSEPFLEMHLNRLLVGQEPIQPAIESVFVHPLAGDPEQVVERSAAIPVLSDVQLARRLA
jgi:hypothetical protein